jgi:hypothetical protein
MMRVIDKGHSARLDKLVSPALVGALGQALHGGAEMIAEDAAESIRAGSISGSGHVASLPGQPPNADTHDLDQSIHVGELIETPGRIQTAVIADSDHAWIELGNSRILPRPYMVPAMMRGHAFVLARVAAAYNRVIRGR